MLGGHDLGDDGQPGGEGDDECTDDASEEQRGDRQRCALRALEYPAVAVLGVAGAVVSPRAGAVADRGHVTAVTGAPTSRDAAAAGSATVAEASTNTGSAP